MSQKQLTHKHSLNVEKNVALIVSRVKDVATSTVEFYQTPDVADGNTWLKDFTETFAVRFCTTWSDIREYLHMLLRLEQLSAAFPPNSSCDVNVLSEFHGSGLSRIHLRLCSQSQQLATDFWESGVDLGGHGNEILKGQGDYLSATHDALTDIQSSIVAVGKHKKSPFQETRPSVSTAVQALETFCVLNLSVSSIRNVCNGISQSMGLHTSGPCFPLNEKTRGQIRNLRSSVREIHTLFEVWKTANSALHELSPVIKDVQACCDMYIVALDGSVRASNDGLAVSAKCHQLCQSLLDAKDRKGHFIELRSMAKPTPKEAANIAERFRAVRRDLNKALEKLARVIGTLRDTRKPLKDVLFLRFSNDFQMKLGKLRPTRKFKPREDDEATSHLCVASDMIEDLLVYVGSYINWWLELESDLKRVSENVDGLEREEAVKIAKTKVATEWEEIMSKNYYYKDVVSEVQGDLTSFDPSLPSEPMGSHPGSHLMTMSRNPALKYHFSDDIEGLANKAERLVQLFSESSGCVRQPLDSVWTQLGEKWIKAVLFLEGCFSFSLEVLVLEWVKQSPDHKLVEVVCSGLELGMISTELVESARQLTMLCDQVTQEFARTSLELKESWVNNPGQLAGSPQKVAFSITNCLTGIRRHFKSLLKHWKEVSETFLDPSFPRSMPKEDVASLSRTWETNRGVLLRAIKAISRLCDENGGTLSVIAEIPSREVQQWDRPIQSTRSTALTSNNPPNFELSFRGNDKQNPFQLSISSAAPISISFDPISSSLQLAVQTTRDAPLTDNVNGPAVGRQLTPGPPHTTQLQSSNPLSTPPPPVTIWADSQWTFLSLLEFITFVFVSMVIGHGVGGTLVNTPEGAATGLVAGGLLAVLFKVRGIQQLRQRSA